MCIHGGVNMNIINIEWMYMILMYLDDEHCYHAESVAVFSL